MKAIIELQQLARKSSTDIVELVRSAYMIATELEMHDFADWCNVELEGYSVSLGVSVPQYRGVSGTLMISRSIGNPVPVNLSDRQLLDTIQTKIIPDSLSSLQGIIKNYKGFIPMDLDHDIKQELIKNYDMGVEKHFKDITSSLNMENDVIVQQMLQAKKPMIIPYLSVDTSQIENIFGTVQNYILKWASECKKKGILGDEWIFTDKEKEMAKNITYHIGSVQNMANHNTESTINQTAQNMSVTKGDLQSLVNFLSDKGISKPEIQELKEIIEIEPNITVDGIQNSKIQQWLGKIAFGGSLVAKGVVIDVIVEAIKQFF